jgi:hypothetical protein
MPTLLAPLGPLPEEAVYTNIKAILPALQDHAARNGYSVVVASSRDQRVVYACSKSGKYRDRKDPNTHESKRRKNTSTIKTDCPFRVVVKKCVDQIGWEIKIQVNNHNHKPVQALSALPEHRIAAIKPEEQSIIRDIASLGHSPAQILNAIRQGNPTSTLIPRDIYNLLAKLRVEELGGKTPIKWLLQVFLVSSIIILKNLLTNYM